MSAFDKIAERYDRPERVKNSKQTARSIKEVLRMSQKGTVIDYGSGTGLIGLDLIEESEAVIFVDKSKKMTEVVERKLLKSPDSQHKVIHGEAEDLIANGLKADFIIVSLVLHHVEDPGKLIHLLYDLLKPAGKMIVVDFETTHKEHSGSSHPSHEFDQKQLSAIIDSSGFHSIGASVIELEEPYYGRIPELFLLVAEK